MPNLAAFVSLLRLAAKDRSHLVLENIVLQHRLPFYPRSVGLPKLNERDRIFQLTLIRVLGQWRKALVIVQPARPPHRSADALATP